MKIDQILSLIRSLAMSTGFYGRLYEDIMNMPDDDRQDYFDYLESLNFKTDLEVILFIEEGKLPEGYEKPRMTDEEIKKAVAEQLVGMIDNNIVRECGVESFRGWLEDGEVFFNNGMTEEEIERAMAYADELETAVDKINHVLGELSY